MAFGLTATGFIPKTLLIINDEIAEELRGVFGASLDMSDQIPLGQFVGVFAEREALLWELIEAIVTAGDPDGATQTLLDAITVLTGTQRLAAVKSATTLTLTGDPATIVASGSKAAVAVSGELFSTSAGATLVATTAWAPTTAYVVGDRVTNAARVYRCITAGTSAGAGGPTTTSADITDNTAHWRYLGEGTADVDVAAKADLTGPTVALSGTITDIETPVSGWSSVINVLDAVVGSAVETDPVLRTRRETELALAGATTAEAIRADLLAVTNVTKVKVFHNDTDAAALFEGVSVPAHAVEALVEGGADQDIFDAIRTSVGAGITTSGTTSGTSTDSEGNAIAVSFTRPTQVNIYVDIELNSDADNYPADGDTQVKAKIVELGDALGLGFDVRSTAVSSWVHQIAGVLEVPVADIGLSADPATSTTLVITGRDFADFDTSRITVVSTPVTP